MPHAVYPMAFLVCPWPGCGYPLEIVDFQLERGADAALYARVVLAWNLQADYGVVGRCPGCNQFVWFGRDEKRAVGEPVPAGFEVLPDDWHRMAFMAP